MTLDAGRRNPTTTPAGRENPAPSGNPSGLAWGSALSPAPVSRVALSNRDLLILVGLARGLTRKEIAHERGICLQHLKNQLTRIYAFLGSASAAQAVYLARHQIEEFVA